MTLGSTVLALASAALLAAASTLPAKALDDNWCKDVHIRFFVTRREGDT